jgi:hypothetical protein
MAKRTDPAPVHQIIDNAEEARPARPGPPALPAGCPVVPVGMQGDDRYYLDAEGQLIALPLEKHGRLRLMGLFCAQNELVYDY